MTEEDTNPFSATNAPGIGLVVQLRLYDVLMGIYSHLDEEKAGELYELHMAGKTLSPTPKLDVEW